MYTPRVGEMLGRYHLDRLLGQGGMGLVFAATDQRLHRTVAVKVITGVLAQNAEFRARFQHEAEALARLESPHVVTIYDHDEIDGTPFIVMQLVEGTDLATLLGQDGALPARTALAIAAQVAGGLADAHERGVLHRDVKPANVLLRRDSTSHPQAFLCDFGIARSEGIDGPAPTATGMIAGTGTYLAPERADGKPATPASDLYSLGCVLWMMLTGSEPYSGTEMQVAIAHQQAAVPQLPGRGQVVRRLNALFTTLLAKDPADRPAGAAQVRAELEALVPLAPAEPLDVPRVDRGATTAIRSAPGVGGAATPSRAPTLPPTTPLRRRGWVLGAAVVAALAVVGGGLAFALTRDDDEPDGTPSDAATDEPEATRAVTGDVDGDGLGDAQVFQDRLGATSPLSVWTMPSTAMRFGSPQRVGALEGVPVWGDIDGDGTGERLWIDANTSDTELLIGVQAVDDTQSTISLPVDPAFGFTGYGTRLADVDGDGDDDLVLLGQPSGAEDVLFVALADDGQFSAPTQWHQGGTSGGYLWTGDVNGDGADEVVLYSQSPTPDGLDTLTVLEADGETFAAAEPRELRGAAVNPYVTTWLVGDVDGDGTDELVVESGIRRGIYVYRFTDGAIGTREEWSRTVRGADEAREQLYASGIRSYVLSDVDGDGADDLVQLYEPLEGESDLRFSVRTSDGSSFGDEADWGRLPCGEECTDSFTFIS
ncbi:protein kinase [Nocardioides sp. C4-1]|uniref:protein kinase domain-containing protein n=1 Tax=Nocardioides sp. C4-1 TaxID=3151851 RepID=UPI0032650E58